MILPTTDSLLRCFLFFEHDTCLACSEHSVQTKEGRNGSGKKVSEESRCV